MATSFTNNITCPNCHRQFDNQIDYGVHSCVSMTTTTNPSIWQCYTCKLAVSKRPKLLHLCRHDQVAFDARIRMKNVLKIPSQNDVIENKENNLNRKPKSSSSRECNVPLFEKIACSSRLYQCEFCNRTFCEKKNVVAHQAKHHTARNYECMFCTDYFDCFRHANRHWRARACDSDRVNSFAQGKQIVCRSCLQSFESHKSLYTHQYEMQHLTPKRHSNSTTFNEIGEPQVKRKCHDKENSNVSMASNRAIFGERTNQTNISQSVKRKMDICDDTQRYQCQKCAKTTRVMNVLIDHYHNTCRGASSSTNP